MSNRLSVVVPSVNGLGDLIGCVEALEAQRRDVDLEVLVVDRLGGDVPRTVKQKFPAARVIEVPQGTTIPEMRALAFREATGDGVAVIEDHVIVPAGWARALLAQLDLGHDVVGGAVENAATGTLLDWAAFLCEYSHCMPPLPEGSVPWLTGNNVVYRRSVLAKYQSVADEGKWENRLHDAMRADGIELTCRSSIVIGHKKHYTFGEYLSQRYLYSRSYAGARAKGAPLSKRMIWGFGSFLLPPVLFWRTIRRITSRGGHGGLLARSLPMIAVFCVSWAWGDVVGSFCGAGSSLSKVC
jgi:hypothetical protein